MNDTGGVSRDTEWLTYQELADRLGIDVQSARRRVLRAGWRKMPGNDGKARVAVPVTVLPAAGATVPATGETEGATVRVTEEATAAATATGQPGLLSRLLSQAADARELADRRAEEVADLRERLGRAEGETLALRGRVAAEREARERAEAREAAERERAARLEAERDTVRAELDAWTAGGPLTRAVRALLFRRAR